ISRTLEPVRAQSGQLSDEVTVPDSVLIFRSKQGKIVAKLTADRSGGLLVIYNSSEKPAASIAGSEYGGGGVIGLTNGKGVGDMVQIAGTENGARFVLLSTHGKP